MAVTPTSPNKDQAIGKPSPQTIPEDPATSGSSTEPLSDKLDRQGGVIHPPSDVDPGMTQAPPAISPESTPVIPPPGSPGGKPGSAYTPLTSVVVERAPWSVSDETVMVAPGSGR